LLLPEALIVRGTLRDTVTPAVPEEQYAFFTTRIARSLAVEMHHTIAAKLNGTSGEIPCRHRERFDSAIY